MTTPRIDAPGLRAALSPPTYMAIFDDDNTGNVSTVDASAQVAQILARAHVTVDSFLVGIYQTMPADLPSPVSELLVDAELAFAIVYAYRRHPEYVKTYGAEASGPLYKEALEKMERIQAGTQQIPPDDNPPANEPGNVGGFTTDNGNRIISDNADGTTNSGDF